MSEVADSTQKPTRVMAEEDSGTTYQYIAVNLNGAEKVRKPPLTFTICVFSTYACVVKHWAFIFNSGTLDRAKPP